MKSLFVDFDETRRDAFKERDLLVLESLQDDLGPVHRVGNELIGQVTQEGKGAVGHPVESPCVLLQHRLGFELGGRGTCRLSQVTATFCIYFNVYYDDYYE